MPSEPQGAQSSGHALFRELLAERNQAPHRIPDIDTQIRTTFEQTVAILVLDMSGFSRLTMEFGIIHYLAMIEQMDNAARPAVAQNGGAVIKQEADNIFATFPTAEQALAAARDILLAFDAVNTVVPDSRDLYASFGIGFGPTLVIEGKDFFGCEVNTACKLGEDLAERHEILLTEAAYAQLPPDKYDFEQRKYAISGLELDAYLFVEPARADTRPLV